MWGVEFPGYETVKSMMERHPAMLPENQMDAGLPCQHCIAQNRQTGWRRKGTGAPPPERLGQPTLEPTPHSPATPFVPPAHNKPAHLFQIKGLPPGYVYIQSPLPSAQCFNHDAYTKDRERDDDFDPDWPTNEETSTG